MLRKFTLLLSVLVIFTMLAGSSASAQAPMPQGTMPGGYLWSHSNPSRGAYPRTIAGAPTGDGPYNAQTIALGKPGTVFGYVSSMGQVGVPYFEDTAHIYTPIGLTLDGDGNLYVAEENGSRVLKFDSAGAFVWQLGKAGGHDWGTYGVDWPKDVVLGPDGSLWVADNNIVTQVDAATGDVLQHIPPEPWNNPDDAFRFNQVRGMAFDSGGRMYVADADRHRVQVFSFDGEGNPQYEATLGLSDKPGNAADQFNWPGQIVVDDNDIVYVADINNARVQKCTPDGDTWPWGWTCTTFDGSGGGGGNNNQLSGMFGLGLKPGSDDLYIADEGNNRIKQVHNDGTMEIYPTLYPATDVAVLASGEMFVASWPAQVVTKMDADGQNEAVFLGEVGVPYLTNDSHFNMPRGIEVTSKGALIMVEEQGNRMFKFNPDGSLAWKFGVAGIPDDNHPQDHLAWPQGVATDKLGQIWVVGGGNHVRIYADKGTSAQYLKDFDRGGFDWKYWDDPDINQKRFCNASGIAIDSAGYIYISDRCTQRVMVYDQNGAFVRQLGEATVGGQDNAHFNQPIGLAVDAARNLYVADQNNCRVQKFDKNGVYKMTFGTGLWCGDRYDQLGNPRDVAVDKQGNLYVVEESTSRVMVYDKTGAYLTNFNSWGYDQTGFFRNPNSLALDAQGNIFVTDTFNARIEKFSRGVLHWGQVNLNGFGQRDVTGVWALGSFKNKLYAGAFDRSGRGAQLWVRNGTTWQMVMSDGFGDSSNSAVSSLQEFNGYLYAGTANWQGKGAQLWRSPDGLNWQLVTMDAFNHPENMSIVSLAVLGGKVCAGTGWGDEATTAGRVWCSATGESGAWTPELDLADLGYLNTAVVSLAEYNGALYAGIQRWSDTDPTDNGAMLWRKTGTVWAEVAASTFDRPDYKHVSTLQVFKGCLYAATEAALGTAPGVYRTCDGSTWTSVAPTGLGTDNEGAGAIKATSTRLYYSCGNATTGIKVYESADGVTWTQVGFGGFGDSNNATTMYGSSALVFKNALYLGTLNDTGGELWKFCGKAKTCK